MTAYFLALVTVVFCLSVAAAIARSAAHPDRPLWPPLNFSMRDRVLAWTVTIVAIGSAYMAGRASWNAWDWPVWIRWYVGFPLAFVFSSLSSWSIVRLGLDQSMGANNGLVTDGPFAYVRHPTYLGNLVLCAGWILLAASWPALIAAGALAALYLYAVPHEERWLARTYGADYESYRARVKRWGL